MDNKISAIILTKNEEKNIEECLQSVKWCDEIIIIDDYSNDGTIHKIQNPNIKVQIKSLPRRQAGKIQILQRKINGDFGRQRNFGLSKATGDWVLFIDADERISKELAEEIKTQILDSKAPDINGYYIKRQDFFLGKWLKHGETGNIKLIRLGKKGSGSWEGEVHEKWLINGETDILKTPLIHYHHRDITEFLHKINLYSDLVVRRWANEGKKIPAWEIFIYPAGKFINNYLFRLGFLDGVEGFIIAMMMSFHSFLARGKYWLGNRKKVHG